jgi:hypothetical protein
VATTSPDSNNISNVQPSLAATIISDNALPTSTGKNLPIFQPVTSGQTAESAGDNLSITQPATVGNTTESTPSSEDIIATTQTAPGASAPESPFGEAAMTMEPTASTHDDVVMTDMDSAGSPLSELRLPQNDDNLPPWLMHTIKYLRSVSEENAWQNLLTEFVTFEKSGPPVGVSLFVPMFRNCGI